jgi:Chaperone of endosialidase
MKKLFSFFTFYSLLFSSYSQSVGIGTTTPNASAILDISSTTKGLLMPRMTSLQMNVIPSPAAGLMVFNLTDSSFYVRKNSGWTKLIPAASGTSNWTANGNNIYNSNTGNIGIGTTAPSHARMEVNGTVGAAVAMFGADKYGVTIEADNPEVGFNYFYNNGTKTIKAGYASVIGMAPGTGEFYIGNYNGNQSSSNFGDITGYRQNLTLFQNGELRLAGSTYFSHFFTGSNEDTYIRGGKDGSNVMISDLGGRVGIGMGNPTRAALEQNGAVGNTAAIFGGEGAGISLQRNWPAIGFNEWYDGANHKTISFGYSAQMGLSQNTGSIYLVSWPYNAGNNTTLGSFTQRIYLSRFGKIGIGVEEPLSDIHIVQSEDNDVNNFGLRLQSSIGAWNVSTTAGYLNFYWNGVYKASISSSDGSYSAVSDANFKKEIKDFNGSPVLTNLLQLRPVSYLMKEENPSSKFHFGFISQEVERIFPQVVNENKGIKVMNYQALIPITIQAIKEQQQQIEELKNEIAELKKLIIAKK